MNNQIVLLLITLIQVAVEKAKCNMYNPPLLTLTPSSLQICIPACL
uniref:Uncharacterized protein n=1 Tax=Arundo donax TaxID=35708 RepID=A0A0A9FUQ3_ARUDO